MYLPVGEHTFNIIDWVGRFVRVRFLHALLSGCCRKLCSLEMSDPEYSEDESEEGDASYGDDFDDANVDDEVAQTPSQHKHLPLAAEGE